VVGKRIASARLTIARRHCSTGKVGHAYSQKRKKGVVVFQNRRPGRVLPARSRINLVVSRGRRR
jgi:beta-lactam-binding protein with PASTA domain